MLSFNEFNQLFTLLLLLHVRFFNKRAASIDSEEKNGEQKAAYVSLPHFMNNRIGITNTSRKASFCMQSDYTTLQYITINENIETKLSTQSVSDIRNVRHKMSKSDYTSLSLSSWSIGQYVRYLNKIKREFALGTICFSTKIK